MKVKKQVFLSYAHPDLKIARKIYQGLTDRKLDVWLDKKCLKPGEWKPQIESAISNIRYFLFCMSNASMKRAEKGEGFQSEEFDFAYNIAVKQSASSFTIIPIRLEDCDRGDLRMTKFNQYDLFEDFDGTLDRLAVDMGGISLSDKTAKDERTEKEKLVDRLFGKAFTLYSVGNYQGSENLINAIIELKPNYAEARYNKGILRGKLGKSKEALASFKKTIELKPDFAEAWTGRGVALGKLKKHKEALASFNKAIELKPNYADSWYNRGTAFVKLGKSEEALASFKKTIELKPDFTEAWYNRGIALEKLGRQKEANESFRKARELGHKK